MLRLKGQRTSSECAVACLGNALSLWGRRIGRKRIIKALGGDASLGFDACDILPAITKLGHCHRTINTNDPATARAWLRFEISKGPVMLATRDWSHWELVTGPVGTHRASVHDPETGSYFCTLPWLYRTWRAHRLTPKRCGAPKDGVFYGIAVGGKSVTL